MKNITFSAEESLIRKARERAAREKRTLNSAFRSWLARYARGASADYDELMKEFAEIRSGKSFARDEMNER